MRNYSIPNVIGESAAIQRVLDQASLLADIHRPVLVVGERGTGKELITHRLHYLSQRWEHPFVKLNCATFTETLLESELFGHESGSFTGASRLHKGHFEEVGKGTLFFDEITSMSPRLQEKLLRVIEYGEFSRIGSSKTLHTEARIIGAANQDLPQLAAAGHFRQDLLDRMAFDVITLPPLRARQEDIEPLAQAFGLSMAKELHWSYFPGFTPGVIAKLIDYPWFGNVRELKNVIERSVYHSPLDTLVEEIIFDPFDSPYRTTPPEQQIDQTSSTRQVEQHPCDILPAAAVPDNFKKYIENIEKETLQKALSDNQFHQRHTAAALGLSYHQFRGYLKKYNLMGKRGKAGS